LTFSRLLIKTRTTGKKEKNSKNSGKNLGIQNPKKLKEKDLQFLL
jgi:hypothetical protein